MIDNNAEPSKIPIPYTINRTLPSDRTDKMRFVRTQSMTLDWSHRLKIFPKRRGLTRLGDGQPTSCQGRARGLSRRCRPGDRENTGLARHAWAPVTLPRGDRHKFDDVLNLAFNPPNPAANQQPLRHVRLSDPCIYDGG